MFVILADMGKYLQIVRDKKLVGGISTLSLDQDIH
jgi:hypothetical protein